MKMELRRRAIDKVYKRRDRIEMPDFQREEVWSPGKKRLLIDSILRGWHLPKFYFRVVEDGTFECVDGQQRLVAIWEFYDNKIVLDDDAAASFGGSRYAELPDAVSDAFDDFELEIEEIEDASEDQLEELFQRLQLGTPLNTAEKLNAIGGNLKNFAKQLALHPFFKDKIALRDTRFAHFVIALQWLFIEARGVHAQMRFPQLEAFLRDNRTFSPSSDLAKRAKVALRYLDEGIPHRSNKLRNRANVLSVLMLVSRVVHAGLHQKTAKALGQFLDLFFSDLSAEVEKGSLSTQRELLEYQEAISYGSTGGDSIRTRIRILTRRLVTKHPEFAPMLGDTLEHRNSTERALQEQADVLADLVYKVNERFAAQHGDDLFKVTNQSAAGLKTLAIPVEDAPAFGELVDAMYVLFYEGSGACNRLPTPPPQFVMDVKFLRTGIRHDLDHGDTAAAAKKRVRKGEVFRKYSGKETLDECAPEDLLATQLRLLDAARKFLDGLSA